ncbi:MAG: hypothetical protein Q9170_007283 [Blastenia crenularia]
MSSEKSEKKPPGSSRLETFKGKTFQRVAHMQYRAAASGFFVRLDASYDVSNVDKNDPWPRNVQEVVISCDAGRSYKPVGREENEASLNTWAKANKDRLERLSLTKMTDGDRVDWSVGRLATTRNLTLHVKQQQGQPLQGRGQRLQLAPSQIHGLAPSHMLELAPLRNLRLALNQKPAGDSIDALRAEVELFERDARSAVKERKESGKELSEAQKQLSKAQTRHNHAKNLEESCRNRWLESKAKLKDRESQAEREDQL